MGQNPIGQHMKTPTRNAVATKDVPVGRARAVLAGIVALVVVLAVGWLVAGLPGLRHANTVSVALLLIALVSGSLTLLFVAETLRKARKRESTGTRNIVIVVVCSLITAAVAIIQLIQTIQQLPH